MMITAIFFAVAALPVETLGFRNRGLIAAGVATIWVVGSLAHAITAV